MKIKFYLTVCAWSVFICAISGQVSLGKNNLLNGEQGLSQTTNEFFYKDSKGYIWVSSIDGLNRLSGSSVKVFKPDREISSSIRDANVQSPFFEDESGDVWFTVEAALNRFNRKLGNFDNYILNNNKLSIETSPHYAFYIEQKRYLWTIAGGSLYRYDTKYRDSSTLLHPLFARRCAVLQDQNEHVSKLFACYWLTGHGFEMITYDGANNIIGRDTFFSEKTKPATFSLTVSRAIPISDSLVWFATDRGLLKFNPLNPNQFRLFHHNDKLEGLRDIYQKKGGTLWVVTASGVVLAFDRNQNFSAPLTDGTGKTVIDARTLMVDDENTLWYSVFGSGVFFSKFMTKQFRQPFFQNTESKLEINSLFEDRKGNMFCTGKQGNSFIVKPNGQTFDAIKFPSRSRFFQDSEEKIWNISSEGLGFWSDKKGKVVSVVRFNGIRFSDIIELPKRCLLIGTSQQVIKVSLKDFSVQFLSILPTETMDLHLDRSNRLWVGGINEDLSIWEMPENAPPVPIRTIPNSRLVHHLWEDKRSNCMWAATANGLLRVDCKTLRDTLITKKDGLPNQYIYAVVPDTSGNVWLSTNQGIIKYMPYKPIGQQFKQYTTLNGLSANEYLFGAGLISQMGEIWFGSTRGVDVFHPDSIHDIGSPPQLAIVGLKIHDHEWRDSTTSIEMAERIELAYNENTLRLELAAMEYTDPEMNKFRVWLSKDGGKPDTVELGTQNFITYANLRPGNYVFQFTACNSEGIWQETPRRLEIIITPHFSDTWQFKAFVAVLALAFIGFATAFYYRYRLRLQQLALEKQQREAERKQLLLENELALQEERNRIADEMHDELGGGLSTIRLASQRAKKVQSPEELQTILKRVSQISIGLVNNMRGIIWAMDSQNDSLRSLLAYIRQYAGTFLDDNGIAATLSLPSDFPEHSLSSQYRHNVMLTVKECLNNILKHADATAVELRASVEDQLLITIQDNGKGFEPTEHAGMGKGLRTTVKRMESVGGSIEWRRNVEGGMTIILLAPLS